MGVGRQKDGQREQMPAGLVPEQGGRAHPRQRLRLPTQRSTTLNKSYLTYEVKYAAPYWRPGRRRKSSRKAKGYSGLVR